MYKKIKSLLQYLFQTNCIIDKSKFGLNAFFNLPLFESENIKNQALDIKNNFKVNNIRVLLSWSDDIQPTPDSNIFFGFIDDVLNNIPVGMNVILVIGNVPSWVPKDSHKVRDLFEDFCKKIILRYKGHRRILGFEISNEPNTNMFVENKKLGFVDEPYIYCLFLGRIYKYAKLIGCKKYIISAATTSIIQNYPSTLKYFEHMLKIGIERNCDIINIHWYGNNLYTMFKKNGALDLLRTIKKPIFITEIGTKVESDQINYLQKNMNFLLDEIKNIKLVFWYHYDGDDEYGMRKPDKTVTKLYKHIEKN